MYLSTTLWANALTFLAALSYSIWRLLIRHSPSALAIGAFALVAALLTLVASTALRYVLLGHSDGPVFWVPIALTLIMFAAVFVYGRLRYGLGLVGLSVMACLTFVLLAYLGLFGWAFVSCTFEACI